jgi:hypothetical protein
MFLNTPMSEPHGSLAFYMWALVGCTSPDLDHGYAPILIFIAIVAPYWPEYCMLLVLIGVSHIICTNKVQ